MVDVRDISVVVQGPVNRDTVRCIASIRKVLPQAELIVSTWENSDCNGLDYDKLVMSADPGGQVAQRKARSPVRNNVNRQIVSTLNGVKAATRKYVFKFRSDFRIVNDNFFKSFDDYPARAEKYKFFKNRVIVSSIYYRCPSKSELCFHPSDMILFGCREDILNFFDVPLQPDEETGLFHPKDKALVDDWTCRYFPEQYIFCSFLKKMGLDFKFENYFDSNPDNVELSDMVGENNFIVIDYHSSGVKWMKRQYATFAVFDIVTHYAWLVMHKKYSNAGFELPRTPFTHLKSYQRLLKHVFSLINALRWRQPRITINESLSVIFYSVATPIDFIATLGAWMIKKK